MGPEASPNTSAHLVLASASPQRRKLLEEAGYAFRVIEPSASAERDDPSGCTPGAYAARAAYRKVVDAAGTLAAESSLGQRIVGCDTVAACEGKILGKPKDRDDARRMLELLRGREHEVYSGLCVWHWPNDEPVTEVAVTRLKMEPLTDAAIEDYLASGAWQGKAGAFGYQDRPGWLRILEGSESNVIGLPMELLERILTATA